MRASDTITVEEVVRKTMEFDGGCESGKRDFLYRSFNIGTDLVNEIMAPKNRRVRLQIRSTATREGSRFHPGEHFRRLYGLSMIRGIEHDEFFFVVEDEELFANLRLGLNDGPGGYGYQYEVRKMEWVD